MLNTIQIGHTKKAFGVKGELKLSVEDKYLPSLAKVQVVFLEISGRQVPYFVEQVRLDFDTFIKLEEVDSKEQASRLTSKLLFLKKEDLTEVKEEESKLYFALLNGYILIDQTNGRVGKILRIEAFPHQEMALVDYQGKEIMIPLNEQLILQIDETQKEVLMDLPEGLLNLS